jgi:hypothetical protein
VSNAPSTKGRCIITGPINHVSSHMNALKALSLNVPVQDLMLNHLMLATLDSETQREWELITASRADTPRIAELVTFLESIYRALELLQNTQSLKTVPATKRSSQSIGSKVDKPSYSNVATQLQCPSCNGSHRLFKCDRFLKMQAKQCLDHAKQLGLCFNCWLPFTKNHTCSRQVCRQCHRRHHTLLHIDRINQMTGGLPQQTNYLQMQRATQLQRLTLIVHSRASPEITFYLQQPLL